MLYFNFVDENGSLYSILLGERTLYVLPYLTCRRLLPSVHPPAGVPPTNQKLLFKGQLKDAATLRETGLKNGSKLMVIGTKPEDTKVATTTAAAAAGAADWDAPAKKEPWSQMAQHKKVWPYFKCMCVWVGGLLLYERLK